MFSEQLFKNFSCLLQSNERLNDIDISLEKAKDKRDICDSVSEAQSQASNQKGIFQLISIVAGLTPKMIASKYKKKSIV